VEENYARVVTIGIMLWAWVTQTHYEFQGIAWHDFYPM
jgi:hypothetical protein